MGIRTLYKGYDDLRVLRDLSEQKTLKCPKNWWNAAAINT